jgi:hypothetical protein
MQFSFDQDPDQRALDRVLEMLECGDVFLIKGRNDNPLSPMVQWKSEGDDKDKGRWVVSVFGNNPPVKSSLESIVRTVSRRRYGGSAAESSLWNKIVGGAKGIDDDLKRGTVDQVQGAQTVRKPDEVDSSPAVGVAKKASAPTAPEKAREADNPTSKPESELEPKPGSDKSKEKKQVAEENIPDENHLPKQMNDSMQNSYKNSFPEGKSQEHGGTLVKDKQGRIKVVNESAGTSGTFTPNRSVDADDIIFGTYHTHPYDKSEGGYKGVSFSGGDIAYANHYKEQIYVDAGSKQFMVMPTNKTPNVDAATLNNEWNSEFQKMLADGNDLPEASAIATKKVTKKYGMAYYEGKNGTLKLIVD